MSEKHAQIWGPVLASLLAGAGEITRAAIAARLRQTAEDIERGDIVSDATIDAAIDAADAIARAQRARR